MFFGVLWLALLAIPASVAAVLLWRSKVLVDGGALRIPVGIRGRVKTTVALDDVAWIGLVYVRALPRWRSGWGCYLTTASGDEIRIFTN